MQQSVNRAMCKEKGKKYSGLAVAMKHVMYSSWKYDICHLLQSIAFLNRYAIPFEIACRWEPHTNDLATFGHWCVETAFVVNS